MEDSEKVEIIAEKPEEKDTKDEDDKKLEEKAKETEVIDASEVVAEECVPKSEAKLEEDPPLPVEAPEVTESTPEKPKEPEPEVVELKVMEEPAAAVTEVKEEEVKEPPIAIEECDTGGDEVVPSVSAAAVEVVEDMKVVQPDQKSEDEPFLLAELTTVVPEIASSPVVSKLDPEVVALDDDDDDDADDIDDIDDSEDPDEDDDDDDVEGVSNEALNDDDEEDEDDDLYARDENAKMEAKSSREELGPEDLDDDYDEDDDDDMIDLKDDSLGAVVIGSSDDEEPPPKMIPKEAPKHHQQQQSSQLLQAIKQQQQLQQRQEQQHHHHQAQGLSRFDDIELDYDEDEDDEDEDDDYDDDDLMNAVVTSAVKNLSPPKKRPRSESPVVEARQREAHQISVLTRRINYGRIAKKKSLNWLYNKKKREAYKLILPKHKPRNYSEAMRSDQSGGLLHLKISSPSVSSIGQKALIKASTSTPIISRIESSARPGPASRTHRKQEVREECVIDLDSSPEKNQEKIIPRQYHSDEQPKLEFDLKKPLDNSKVKKEDIEEEQPFTKMQQTDKVRDSIQKSTEEVEEVKSAVVARLTCEQNKENLQSNEALKKDSDEAVVVLTAKDEAEVKVPATASTEDMDTSEQEASKSTLKATEFIISTVTSLKAGDIKQEKLDKEDITTPPPKTAEEELAVASKVTIEDVAEKEAQRATASPHPAPIGGANNKRRRSSSSITGDKTKASKPGSASTAALTAEANQDDEEYIHPTKKLREELQFAYPAHDRILNEYIEKTSNDSIDTIQRHIEQMLSEIQTLNDMIKAKEVEWNNMLHLKKVKEEICFRLTRRKQCMEIMTTKVGEAAHSAGLDEDYISNESAIILAKSSTPANKPNIQLSSTPIAAAISSISSNICNYTAVSSSSSAPPTTAQLIIQNRANMKSSDLVKEKANTLRLHRLLVSRNILPKPTASNNTTLTGNNSQQQQQQQSPSTNGPTSIQQQQQQQPNASNQPILNSYLTATDSVQQLVDMMNGHHNHSGLQNGGTVGSNNSQAAMVGRQGPFKDVRSIIADFRQQHPEVVPRRGRRVKTNNNSNLSDSNTILANALKSDTNSRPSSNDSSSHSMSNTNQVTTNHNSVNSFKDVLAPFSKSQGAVRSAGGQQQNPPYPEVTLHPVSTPLNASGGQDQPTGSLLHGILTKFSRPTESANTKSAVNQASANYISNFSPTLARLLTAPERISPSGAGSGPNQSHHNTSSGAVGDGGGSNAHHSMPGFGVNLSKVVGHNSEITITPVMNSMHQQSILQQQLQQQQIKDVLTRAAAAVGANNSVKDEHFLKLSSFVTPSAPNNDDDAEDSVDRLVIDEGDLMSGGGDELQRIAPHAIGQEFNENEVPVCQGCKKHEAQFVCAGCGNQWYCSRECQVTAWDDHSEVCTG